MLSDQQRERFARQLVLEGVREEGQEQLQDARVLVVGAGGLGSPVCLYLAAAGVGTLGLVDFDVISPSNLNRQILYRPAEIGVRKTVSATQTLQAFAPDMTVIAYPERMTAARAIDLVTEYDLVIECSDNFDTKFLVNEACVAGTVPLVWASVLAWEGQMSVVMPGECPCYRCLFPAQIDLSNSPTSREVGILGAVAGVFGALEAVEAIKVLLGIGEPLTGRLLVWDGWLGTFEVVAFSPQSGCPVCGGG